MNNTIGQQETAKQVQISMKILAQVANGKTVREAIDAVIGAGTCEKLIGEVYDALRAKAKDTRLTLPEALEAAAKFPHVFINVRTRLKRNNPGHVTKYAEVVTRGNGTVMHTSREYATVDEAHAAAVAWVGSKRARFESQCVVLQRNPTNI